MANAHGRFFYRCNDAHQKLRSALRLFTPDTPFLSLFGTVEQDYDAPKKNFAFGYSISDFLVLTGFTRRIIVINNKLIVILITP